MQIYDLQNGIRVFYYPLPNTYSVAFGLYINAGVKSETEESNGITHLLEHLHFRKLGNWEQNEIYYNMNKIGAALNGSTYKEMLRFSMKVRPMYFLEGIEFFTRILTTYDWTEKHLFDEKQIVLNELYSKEPYMSISPYVDKIVWKDTVLSMPIIGNFESIKNITLDKIVQYKRQCFCESRTALVITGNVTEKHIQEAIYKVGQIKLNDYNPKYTKNDTYSKVLNRKPDIKYINCGWDYVDVNVSFDVDNCNIAAASLFNSIIGGGIGSILPNVIREEMGLVYDIYSTLDLYNSKSVLNIIFSTEKKNISMCIEAIVNVFNWTKNNITSEFLTTNIPYFTENSWYLLEDPEALNEEIGWSVFSEDPLFSIEKKIEMYRKIDECALMNFAKNTLVSKNAAVVVMGNTSNITKKEMKRIIDKLG